MTRESDRQAEIVDDAHGGHLQLPPLQPGQDVAAPLRRNAKLSAFPFQSEIFVPILRADSQPHPVEFLTNVSFCIHSSRRQRAMKRRQIARVMVVRPLPVVLSENLVDVLGELPRLVVIVATAAGFERYQQRTRQVEKRHDLDFRSQLLVGTCRTH